MRELWWLETDARGPLERHAELNVAQWMQAAREGEFLSSDRQSVVVRLDGAPVLLVKWRRPRAGAKQRRTLLRSSRERKEASAALRLSERGIASPLPWAVGERRDRGLLVGSVLIRPFLKEAVDARAGCSSAASLGALGRTLRIWHDKGFRHGDCYPKNVLLCDGEAPVMPLGCPAARFRRPGSDLDRLRRKDLAQWAAGTYEQFPETSSFAFLESYCRAPGMPSASLLEAAVRPQYERILRKKGARRASEAARDAVRPRRPEALPLDAPPGPRVRELPLQALWPQAPEGCEPSGSATLG